MNKKISYVFYRVIFFLNILYKFLTKKDFLIWFKDFIENDTYTTKNILNHNIKFFTPNYILKWRVDTYFTKEPETLEWIDNFKNDEKIIFWDIGANIGLYSIYAALKYPNLDVTAFEPSTSNLRALSRNLSINKLEERIKIFQIPLTNKENKFLLMRERQFVEGSANHTLDETFDANGKKINTDFNYKIYATSINYILDNKILDLPDYIKIDVDGIEHLILEGGNNYLKNPKLKSISVEVNELFDAQLKGVLHFMHTNNFRLVNKKNHDIFHGIKSNKKIFNYIFNKIK